MSHEDLPIARVSCRNCGYVVFEGEWDDAAADAAAKISNCPECGSIAREYKIAASDGAKVWESFKAAVVGPERHSAKHRARQEQWGGLFPRGDRRGYVYREMIVDRDHDPPYKWHRVTDERTGVVEKNLLERHGESGQVWDFREPSTQPPDWLSFDPRDMSRPPAQRK
jgi:hypothetical protein